MWSKKPTDIENLMYIATAKNMLFYSVLNWSNETTKIMCVWVQIWQRFLKATIQIFWLNCELELSSI